MTSLCCEVLARLRGRTLATAESCTGGMIGAALTAVPGSSQAYAGGVISYQNRVKAGVLGVSQELLDTLGPVSESVAKAMALGVRSALGADVAVSVTGLAGPGGDDFGNPVGTVFIGFSDGAGERCRAYRFYGTREEVRLQAARAALELVLEFTG